MQFFLDTADVRLVEHWEKAGLVQGVTTNPKLLSDASTNPIETLRALAKLTPGPVFAQVTESSIEGMVNQAKKLTEIAENIVVKVPATFEGLMAARKLHQLNILCNATQLFEVAQLIGFCRIPTAYASVIIARSEDYGANSRGTVRVARKIVDQLNSTTQLIFASIRSAAQLALCVMNNPHAVTVPPMTWEKIYGHPTTRAEVERMLSAWSNKPMSPLTMTDAHPSR